MPIMTLCYYSHRDGLVKTYLDSEWEGFEDWIDYIIDQIDRGSHLYDFFYLTVSGQQPREENKMKRYTIWATDDYFKIYHLNEPQRIEMDADAIKLPARERVPIVTGFMSNESEPVGMARNIIVEDGNLTCELDMFDEENFSEEKLENLMELYRLTSMYNEVTYNTEHDRIISATLREVGFATKDSHGNPDVTIDLTAKESDA